MPPVTLGGDKENTLVSLPSFFDRLGWLIPDKEPHIYPLKSSKRFSVGQPRVKST